MDEKVINILNAIEKLESRVNAYWNFYTIVVVAVSGWLFAASNDLLSPYKTAITIAIAMFFFSNFSVMRAATKRVVALESELNLTSKELEFNSNILKSELSNNSMPGRLMASYLLHAVVDIAVIFAIWIDLDCTN